MDMFDTVGTLAGVGESGGFVEGGRFPRVGRAMMSDAVGACVCAVYMACLFDGRAIYFALCLSPGSIIKFYCLAET